MKSLRTPDERFADLPDFPFAPNYVDISDQDADEPNGTLRVHSLDEGPADEPIVLAMHGEPSWSYLYRKMIPILVAGGARVIAPDLVGFGNTGLPTGEHAPSDAFMAWQKFSQTTEVFDIGFLLDSATITELSEAEIAAYDAPFPDDTFKAGARIFPSLVPTSPDDPAAEANRRAWEVFQQWSKPLICCFSDGDPVTAGGDTPFLKLVPGAEGQPHTTVEIAHHFFQADAAPVLARIILDAIARD